MRTLPFVSLLCFIGPNAVAGAVLWRCADWCGHFTRKLDACKDCRTEHGCGPGHEHPPPGAATKSVPFAQRGDVQSRGLPRLRQSKMCEGGTGLWQCNEKTCTING